MIAFHGLAPGGSELVDEIGVVILGNEVDNIFVSKHVDH